jgi:hypothetical protein
MTRSFALAAFLAVIAAPAVAQTAGPPVPNAGQTRSLAPSTSPTAAATLPNTFDEPTAAPAAFGRPVATPSQADVTDADVAEGVLRVVIADLAEGELDAALFTPDLAGRLRPQLPTLRPIVQGFGALELIESQGLTNGAAQFLVTFENAATQWVVGLNDEGLVSALLFRPAPPASSEPDDEPEAEPAPTDDR